MKKLNYLGFLILGSLVTSNLVGCSGLNLLRRLIFVLIAVSFLGCGNDEDSSSEITVTMKLVRQEGEKVWFRLHADPAPMANTAILIKSQSFDNQAFEYAWIIMPEFTDSHEFNLSLDEDFLWRVWIQPLVGININDYSTEGFDIPLDFEFRLYRADPFAVTTVRTPPAKLLTAFPQSGAGIGSQIPANATLTFVFDTMPKDIMVSHGRAIADGEVLTISGPFPLGDIAVEISWDKGRENYTWYHVITAPDFEPPKAVRARAPEAFEFWGFFNDELDDGRLPPDIELIEEGLVTWSLSSDAELIEIYFNEAVWVHEKVTGNMDIQTEDGTNLGWQMEDGFLFFDQNKITLSLSDGKPLSPATNYVVSGRVTDFANETEVKIPFATGL